MANWWQSFIRRRSEAKGLSISLAPGGFVTEIRDYRRSRAPSADTATLQDTMQLNELVFACIGIKATAAQDPRLLVQRAVKDSGATKYEEVTGHPFRSLMMRPNPLMTEADLMRAAIVSWDVSNPRRFYCEKVFKGNLLIELWPLNPACMRPIASRTPPYATIGYEWTDGQARREYSAEELLIRSAPAWYDPPPLLAALGATKSDSAQTDYVSAFFENGGVPPGLLKYKTVNLSQPQRNEVRERWRSVYGNAFGRQHDIGVLDGEVDYQEIGSRMDQLASQTLRSVAESRIAMVFGVPPLIVYAYVGLLRATYSNLRDAWAGFWDATMSPAFREWRNFWTWHLLTEFEDERTLRSEAIRLNYDMSQVSALQDDVDAMQTRARANFTAGIITQDEARAALGFAPMPKAAPAEKQADAAPANQDRPILGYHIEQGVVSKNEARAQLGLPQEDDSRDQMLRQLMSTLAVLQAAVNTQIPLDVALPLVGLDITLPAQPPAPIAPAKGAKARTKPSIQSIERRMEKALHQYLSDEYKKAAEAVRA